MFRRFFEHICKHRKLDWNESTAIVAEMVSIPRPNDYVEPIHPVYADALNLIAHLKISDYNIWYPPGICILYPVYAYIYADISNLIAYLKISDYNIWYPYLICIWYPVYPVSRISRIFHLSRLFPISRICIWYPLPYANVLNSPPEDIRL